MVTRTLYLLAVALSLALTLLLTPLVRAFARSRGIVARPKSDRWHKKPTALMGGVAIFVSVAFVVLTLVPGNRQTYVLFGASAFLFLVGLVDDFLRLKPYQKLIGQLLGAMPVISTGITLPWIGSPALDMAITILWLVGITNSINLLDNMDGLAAGVALIGASFLALNFGTNGHPNDALMLTVFAAALLGYLMYNSHPASIFMGDCGSMFIGFFLASTALLNPTSGRSCSFLPVLAVPVLILFIPIFDTFFVMVLRKLAGRAASQGGRDHTSHRLVALGLSERCAVWMLYAFAVASGLLALLVRDLDLDVSLAAIVGFTIVLTLLGVHLAGVKVYEESELGAASHKPLVAFLVDLSYKRRVFEVLLDVLLIVLSYYASFALVFGPITQRGATNEFLLMVPVHVCIKTVIFLAMGIYRGIWRYVSLDSLLVYTMAVLVGTIISIFIFSFILRSQSYSRVIFVLDGLILLFLLAGSAWLFNCFGCSCQPPSRTRVGGS
jgi:UDP-GlcNAc:undecaprenyl-phosphate GlcNAc-1-phosphate transferase